MKVDAISVALTCDDKKKASGALAGHVRALAARDAPLRFMPKTAIVNN